MNTKASPSKRGDALKGMLLDELLNELVKFERVMARKSITSAQIEKARSTIRELRLSLEKQIESDSQNETGVKIDKRRRDEIKAGWHIDAHGWQGSVCDCNGSRMRCMCA